MGQPSSMRRINDFILFPRKLVELATSNFLPVSFRLKIGSNWPKTWRFTEHHRLVVGFLVVIAAIVCVLAERDRKRKRNIAMMMTMMMKRQPPPPHPAPSVAESVSQLPEISNWLKSPRCSVDRQSSNSGLDCCLSDFDNSLGATNCGTGNGQGQAGGLTPISPFTLAVAR